MKVLFESWQPPHLQDLLHQIIHLGSNVFCLGFFLISPWQPNKQRSHRSQGRYDWAWAVAYVDGREHANTNSQENEVLMVGNWKISLNGHSWRIQLCPTRTFCEMEIRAGTFREEPVMAPNHHHVSEPGASRWFNRPAATGAAERLLIIGPSPQVQWQRLNWEKNIRRFNANLFHFEMNIYGYEQHFSDRHSRLNREFGSAPAEKCIGDWK